MEVGHIELDQNNAIVSFAPFCNMYYVFAQLHLLIESSQSREQIDSVPTGSVLFVSAPPDIINAVYGGLMTSRAKYCRAAGTVVDGRIRDLQEHRDLGYAVSLLQR